MPLHRGTCQWLLKNTTETCGRSCFGEYCGVHAFTLRTRARSGTNPCKKCGVGVRGAIHLCDNCGRKAYRALLNYYRTRKDNLYIFIEEPPTEEEFIKSYKPRAIKSC